jgi:hypothetical protein
VWGHWSKICQSPKHVIEAYKAKNIHKYKHEAHFTMATNNEAMEEDPTLEASGMPLDLAGAMKMIATEENCWGLVLKCYELRTRQHKKC